MQLNKRWYLEYIDPEKWAIKFKRDIDSRRSKRTHATSRILMKGSLQFTQLDGRFKGNDIFKWMVTTNTNPEYERFYS